MGVTVEDRETSRVESTFTQQCVFPVRQLLGKEIQVSLSSSKSPRSSSFMLFYYISVHRAIHRNIFVINLPADVFLSNVHRGI